MWALARPADLVALAQRDGVAELLVEVGPHFPGDPAVVGRLRRLCDLARDVGITVTALGGDPAWAVRPDDARRWAHGVGTSRLFAALHVDIEPYRLAEWTTDREHTARGLLSALDAVRTTGLPVAADIPAWFHEVRVDGRRLDDAVLKRVDAVTVMAYRDRVAAVLAFARPTLTRAATAGMPATIGVDISPPGEPGTSMHGLTRQQLLTALAAIGTGAVAAGWTSFVGTAIHDARWLGKLRAVPPSS